MEHDRCFVMPLERDEVPKPRSFYDLMNLLNSGAFDLDVKRIRHDYRVVTPAIEGDVQELGSVVFWPTVLLFQFCCFGRPPGNTNRSFRAAPSTPSR